MIKEADALKKFCCGPEGCGTGGAERVCIGSKCMAWTPVQEGVGYCGLAGTPFNVLVLLPYVKPRGAQIVVPEGPGLKL